MILAACVGPTGDTPPVHVPCEPPEPGEICTVAGTGLQGSQADSLPAIETWLNLPSQVSFDPGGLPILTDFNNHKIRLLQADGSFLTLAGNGVHAYAGPDGILATSSPMENPIDAVMADDRTLYITELHGSRILKVDPDGILTTFAGDSYAPGYPDFSGDGGPATEADLNEPVGLALDDAGNVWFADTGNHRIRYVDPEGIIHTLAGNDYAGLVDGVGSDASFFKPHGIAWKDGFLYVADEWNNAVRRVDTDTAEVVTLATGLLFPLGVDVGPDGTVYVTDSQTYVIRRIDPDDGAMELVLGQEGVNDFADGPIEDALLDFPNDVAIHPTGDAYIVDTFNQRLRLAPGFGLR